MIKNKSPFGFFLKLIGIKPSEIVYGVDGTILDDKNDLIQEEMVDAAQRFHLVTVEDVMVPLSKYSCDRCICVFKRTIENF
jgi:hypothetical protein